MDRAAIGAENAIAGAQATPDHLWLSELAVSKDDDARHRLEEWMIGRLEGWEFGNLPTRRAAKPVLQSLGLSLGTKSSNLPFRPNKKSPDKEGDFLNLSIFLSLRRHYPDQVRRSLPQQRKEVSQPGLSKPPKTAI
jgi:hypothetical protein